MRINTLLNEDGPVSTPAPKGPGRGNWSRKGNASAKGFKARLDAGHGQDGQSPSGNAQTFSGPHGFYLPLNGSDPAHKRTRPLTQHQLAVEQYRRRRVEVILDRGIRVEYRAAAKRRKAQSPFLRAWIRCKGMQDGYDTDDDANGHPSDPDSGRTSTPIPAGLIPIDFGGEVDDHGEEAYYRTKMLRRALRRLDRWEENKSITRTKPKSSKHRPEEHKTNGATNIVEDREDDEDEDEDMQDADDALEQREDEDMESDEEEERAFDPNTLPPLPAHMG